MFSQVKQSPIEILLNKIYQEPDLGKEVFEYIAPHALKADQALVLSNNTGYFNNKEELRQLDKIINQKLPQIVDIYSKIPLEYRNQEKLKTGKTHRETLLDNIQVLVQKIKEIEKELYADVDNEAVVNSRIIDEQFGTQLELEDTSIHHLQKEFDVANFKKNHPDFQHKPLPQDHVIKVTSGKIEYKVKNNMKAFMKGVYQSYNKGKKYIVSRKKDIGDNISNGSFYCVVFFSFLGFGLTIAGYNPILLTQELLTGKAVPGSKIGETTDVAKSKEDNSSETLKEVLKLKEYTNASSQGLVDINMKVLEKYSQQHPNMKASLITKENTISFEFKVDKKECLNFINDMNTVDNYYYAINKADISPHEKLSTEQADVACNIENKITLNYNAKKP